MATGSDMSVCHEVPSLAQKLIHPFSLFRCFGLFRNGTKFKKNPESKMVSSLLSIFFFSAVCLKVIPHLCLKDHAECHRDIFTGLNLKQVLPSQGRE